MGPDAFLHVAGEGSPSPLTAPEPSQDQLVVSANQPPLSLAPGAPFPRWWEGPALEILGTSSNVDLLIAICDFDLFQDPMASARALSRQPSARLDAILSVLRRGTVVLDNGLNRVQQTLATLRNKDALSWDPAWFFHSLASSDSVEGIAERLHSTIWSAFCSVTYASGLWNCWRFKLLCCSEQLSQGGYSVSPDTQFIRETVSARRGMPLHFSHVYRC